MADAKHAKCIGIVKSMPGRRYCLRRAPFELDGKPYCLVHKRVKLKSKDNKDLSEQLVDVRKQLQLWKAGSQVEAEGADEAREELAVALAALKLAREALEEIADYTYGKQRPEWTVPEWAEVAAKALEGMKATYA